MTDLPDELWQHTFSFLRLPGGQFYDGLEYQKCHNALLSISLVNKRFNSLGRPALFHTVSLEYRFNDTRLKSLLRILHRDPKTCDLIMSLDIANVDTERDADMDRVGLSDPDNAMTEVYDGILEQLSLPENLIDRLRTWLWQDLTDAQAALLIFMCPRIRYLHIVLPFPLDFDEAMCLEAVRISALSPRRVIFQRPDKPKADRPFEQLLEMEFAHWDTEYASDISRVIECMEAPSLETIRFQQISCDSADVDLRGMQCNARNIYFENSLVEAEGFEHLLAGCSRLQKISIEWGGAVIGDCHIDFAGFGDALRRHGLSLVTLELDPAYILDSFEEEVEGILGDLSTMRVLEDLAVPVCALFKRESDDESTSSDDSGIVDGARWLADTLPTSLKQLRLTDASDDEHKSLHDAQIKELLHSAEHEALETVIICRKEPFSHDLEGSNWQATTKNMNEGTYLVEYVGWQFLERRK